jgi:hypothetical protein
MVQLNDIIASRTFEAMKYGYVCPDWAVQCTIVCDDDIQVYIPVEEMHCRALLPFGTDPYSVVEKLRSGNNYRVLLMTSKEWYKNIAASPVCGKMKPHVVVANDVFYGDVRPEYNDYDVIAYMCDDVVAGVIYNCVEEECPGKRHLYIETVEEEYSAIVTEHWRGYDVPDVPAERFISIAHDDLDSVFAVAGTDHHEHVEISASALILAAATIGTPAFDKVVTLFDVNRENPFEHGYCHTLLIKPEFRASYMAKCIRFGVAALTLDNRHFVDEYLDPDKDAMVDKVHVIMQRNILHIVPYAVDTSVEVSARDVIASLDHVSFNAPRVFAFDYYAAAPDDSVYRMILRNLFSLVSRVIDVMDFSWNFSSDEIACIRSLQTAWFSRKKCPAFVMPFEGDYVYFQGLLLNAHRMLLLNAAIEYIVRASGIDVYLYHGAIFEHFRMICSAYYTSDMAGVRPGVSMVHFAVLFRTILREIDDVDNAKHWAVASAVFSSEADESITKLRSKI